QAASTSGSSTRPGCTWPIRSRFSSRTRCLAWICFVSSRCCRAQPPQVPKWAQRGSTRSGEACSTSSTRASSKLRWRPVCCTRTRSPGSAPATNTVLPACASPSGRRATPRPSWLRSVMSSSKGVWSMRAKSGIQQADHGSALHAGQPTIGRLYAYFFFQFPLASCYHQPERALSIHCWAHTRRIWLSHSGWPLATAISRYTALRSRLSSATALFTTTRSLSASLPASRTTSMPSLVKPSAPELKPSRRIELKRASIRDWIDWIAGVRMLMSGCDCACALPMPSSIHGSKPSAPGPPAFCCTQAMPPSSLAGGASSITFSTNSRAASLASAAGKYTLMVTQAVSSSAPATAPVMGSPNQDFMLALLVQGVQRRESLYDRLDVALADLGHALQQHRPVHQPVVADHAQVGDAGSADDGKSGA